MVFTVELVVVSCGANPQLVERHSSTAMDMAGAARAARAQLDQVRGFYPVDPPDGFIVRNERTGQTICSWDSV